MKTALITGITGQDGSYLAEFLLEKGYEVHGIVRRTSLINTHRIDHIYDRLKLHYGDLTDSTNLISVIRKVKPDEIYNLGAQSHVRVSYDVPEYTAQTDGVGTLRVLEAVRLLDMTDKVRVYQASTSELYGGISDAPLVLDVNASSSCMFSLFHDSWNAFPTFVLLDHTMTVRAKPWTLDSNTNSNSCDGTSGTIN